jgi:hypothetical protein
MTLKFWLVFNCAPKSGSHRSRNPIGAARQGTVDRDEKQIDIGRPAPVLVGVTATVDPRSASAAFWLTLTTRLPGSSDTAVKTLRMLAGW